MYLGFLPCQRALSGLLREFNAVTISQNDMYTRFFLSISTVKRDVVCVCVIVYINVYDCI